MLDTDLSVVFAHITSSAASNIHMNTYIVEIVKVIIKVIN
jgi:hypothetical protein